MSVSPSTPSIAFQGTRAIAAGPLAEVAVAARQAAACDPETPLLVFDDETGGVIDLDLRGSDAEVLARLEARNAPQSDEVKSPGRGRPKLGVVPREVTLLPRHWAWLSAQPGGASNALRRLTEAAMRSEEGKGRRARADREAAYRFMSAMAGDLPGFEEASRALFADDREAFGEHSGGWPADIRKHVAKLAWRASPA